MKRLIALLVVLSLSASFAMADYINPPGWENNPYFTHQSWEFDCDANPASPDPLTVVSPGQPYVSLNAPANQLTWLDKGGFAPMADSAGWLVEGPVTANLATPQIAIYVPNEEHPELRKEIWLQMTFFTDNMELGESLQLVVAAEGEYYPPVSWEAVDVDDVTNGKLRLTAQFALDKQPAEEWVYLTATLPEGNIFFIDEIDVDTRCVPEPSTLAMLLGAGLIGFVVSRRRK